MGSEKLTGLQRQSFAAIKKNERCRWPRHQRGRPDLQVAQRNIASEQQVTLPKNLLLAHIHHRNLLAAG